MVVAINALQPHGFAAELVRAAVQDPLNVGLFLVCSHCIRGSDVAKSKQPGSIACSLSCSVLTKNVFLRWNITNGTNLRISTAIPDQPSTII
jgi:hypothetical protein